MEQEIALRLTVVRPPAGVALAVQRGRGDAAPLLQAHARAGDDVRFDFIVRATADDPPVLRGDVAQGPPAARFVYVTWGVRAGQPGSPWDRRAKVSLHGITRALAERARAGSGVVLAARIAGTGRDGTPACASVPLLDDGWRPVSVDEA